MLELEGKTILIPNAAHCGSFAYQIAYELASKGANLIVSSRKKSNLDAKEPLLKAGAADVLAAPADSQDALSVRQFFDKASVVSGKIDALIMCEQVSVAATNFEQIKAKQLELSFNSGPIALFNWLQAASPILARSRGKALVCLLDKRCVEFAGLPILLSQNASRTMCEQVNEQWQENGATCEIVDTLCLTKKLEDFAKKFPETYAAFEQQLQEKNICMPMSVGEFAAKLVDRIRH